MSKRSVMKRIFLAIVVIGTLVTVVGGYWAYKLVYQPNVSLERKKHRFIHIPTGSHFNDVMDILLKEEVIKNRNTFEQLAELKKYKNRVRPGRYRIKAGMTNNELINMLRAGLQEPLELNLSNIRTKQQLITRVCRRIEADSIEMKQLLYNDQLLQKKYGMSSATILSLFIPNTYEFYWTTSAKEFMEKMAKVYKEFWTAERKAKARQIGLTQTEVAVLASIIEHESFVKDELPTIAGVYMNRIKRGMPLQADPTLVWIIGDFSINRVLSVHKEIDSPYNTYKYKGLPPGPIGLPSTAALDAVLAYEKHNYLYFCACHDFCGKSNFAETYEEHLINARKYQKALNERNIMK